MRITKEIDGYTVTIQDDTVQTKEQKRSKLRAALLWLLVALCAIVTATMAWFTLNSFASVDSMEMTIGTGSELKVATADYGTDLTRYTDTITNEMINSLLQQYNTELSRFKLDPLTSSDGVRLYTEANNEREGNTGGFLEFDLYFIASADMWVHLTTEDANGEPQGGTGVSTTTVDVPEVVQAVRVSFDASNGTKIYEPNKGTAVAGQDTFDLTYPMQYTNTTRLVRLSAMQPQRVTVRVWVEGNDPQCQNNIQNANLGVQLCFKGTDDNNQPV